MGLLDDLKKQAADQKARELSEQEQREQRFAFYKEQIQPKLANVYSYLHEFTEQVNYVTPEIRMSYELPEKRVLADLSQKKYAVKIDSSENTRSVMLRFFCEDDGELLVQEHEKRKFEKFQDFLFEHTLRYQSRPYKDDKRDVIGGEISIEKRVPILFQFDADVENSCILLWIVNFETLGKRKITLLPEQIDESFLDELGRFVLRQIDSFMALDLADAQRDRIREQVEQDKAEKEQEMLIREQERLEEEQRAEERKLVSRLKKQVKKIYGKTRSDDP